jgi:hypothetical protein
MPEAVRWLCFVVGVAIAWFTLASMVSTFVVPRNVSSRITHAAWLVARSIFRTAIRFVSDYPRQDRILSFLGPVAILLLLEVWLVLLLVGYALMLMPFDGGDFGDGIRISGSSILTLGFAAARNGAPTAIIFIAAATGLVVIALLIGYLPTIYNAFNRREIQVTMLESRGGEPAWGPEILAREAFVNGLETLGPLYRDWELWSADLAETHTSHPWLISFRSPHPLRSWIIALLAVLDSAALYLAFNPSTAPGEARNCLRMGFLALRAVAEVYGVPYDPDPLPNAPVQLTYQQYMKGVERMRRAGFPMERTPEDAWAHFRGWRVNYESIAYYMADQVIVVPALWSGPRTYIDSTPIPPFRPVQRSPERPEGVETVEPEEQEGRYGKSGAFPWRKDRPDPAA